MKKKSIKAVVLIILLCLCLQTLSCGTILYPERRGQATGEIDPSVAILDGILLLVVILPGVIAFAVDFTTGAIFKPSKKSTSTEFDDAAVLVSVELPPSIMADAALEQQILLKTGRLVSLSDCRTYRLSSDQSISDFLVSKKFKPISLPN